jgi:type IV pilus assembly protein PilM
MKTLPIEAEPFIPFDIKEVNLGAHILGEVVEEGQKKMETVLVAAKREVIQNRVEILTAAGIAPVIIDVDAFAVEGVHEVSKFKEEQGGVLYLNVGHSVTNLSIIETGVTRVVRDIFISGGSFTKAIQKALGSDWATAQKKKMELGILVSTEEKEKALAEGNQEALAISQALVSVMKDLVTEMQRSVDFYLSQGPERSINRVVLAGGGANLGNLPQALTQELKVPVDVLNPLEFLNDPATAQVPAEVIPALGVAAGLALRKMRDWQ